MTEILLIRHPETDLAGTFCGHSDPPVNAAGEAQMEALLKALEPEQLDAVYTSDLQRARTLAEGISRSHEIPCIVRPGLREIYFGAWEGLTWSEIERGQPEQAAAWLVNYPHQAAPNGEAFAGFQARVLAELDSILAGPQQRVAIVTHAGAMRAILTARSRVDEHAAWSLTKPYCSLVRYSPALETVTR